jgi:hypothetical protein
VSLRIGHPAHTLGVRRDGPMDASDRGFLACTAAWSKAWPCVAWHANLRILDVKEIKTVPYVPLSHPFVERLTGTVRRECLDRTFFWTAADLELKLMDLQRYFNGYRAHVGLVGHTPEPNPDSGRGPV